MNPNEINWYCPLTGIGILGLSGQDAAKFLQGQTTCDILNLPPGRTTLGALCNPKGRAVALFRALRCEDRIFLLLSKELLDTVRKRLGLYVLRADVRIEDATGQWSVFGVFGEQSANTLMAMGLPSLAQDSEAEGQSGLYAIRIPALTAPRFLLLAAAEKTGDIRRLLDEQRINRKDDAFWRLEDIRAGLPAVRAATVEEFVPQMLNLDLLGGISFNKGCYTGQEIIARTHYLGQLKRRMYRLAGAGSQMPQAGEVLRAEAGEGQGMVVDAAPTPEGGFEVLAVIPIAQAEADVRFRTPSGAELVISDRPG